MNRESKIHPHRAGVKTRNSYGFDFPRGAAEEMTRHCKAALIRMGLSGDDDNGVPRIFTNAERLRGRTGGGGTTQWGLTLRETIEQTELGS